MDASGDSPVLTEPPSTPHRLQVEKLRPEVRNRDLPLQLYYDETNNIRRLKLSAEGVKVPTLRSFVIAGVAHLHDDAFAVWAQLRQRLRIQPTATEVKFKHIADGDFEQALAQERLSIFLDWLEEADLLVHCSALNVLHWTLIDIIDSLMVADRIGVIPYHAELKSELYFAVQKAPDAFFALLHAYAYPDVPRAQVASFLSAVHTFVEELVPEDRNLATHLLKHTLERAASAGDLELAFLHDNQAGTLIDNFSVQFLHCMYTFTRGRHVFDNESLIEGILAHHEVWDGTRRVDYRFADSQTEVGIQVSDVVTGLFGKLFNYVQDHSLPELLRRKAAYSPRQYENLARLRALIDRSDAVSDGLFHTVLPFDLGAKHDAFLFDVEVPAFLYRE